MNLLGIGDLAKRWHYTKQGVHQKIKHEKSILKPVAVINKDTLVFQEEDVISYEETRKELRDPKYKQWYTHRRWLYKE